MARLYDRIATEGKLMQVEGRTMRVGLEWKEAFVEATVVAADNVARYLFAENAQEVWEPEDFPVARPPLDPMWIEARAPAFIQSEIHGRIPWRHPRPSSWGWLFLQDGEWTNAALFEERAGREFVGPIVVHHVNLLGNGGLPPRKPLERRYLCSTPFPSTDQRALDWSRSTEPLLDVAWLAISFMHCKNVKRREVDQPRALSKKWRKKHGRPLVRYHVLDIDPLKSTLSSEGDIEANGLKKALHICRGHFAHYPEGLFNRGEPETVWKPQHVRGSAKQGAVVKDYNVRAPE